MVAGQYLQQKYMDAVLFDIISSASGTISGKCIGTGSDSVVALVQVHLARIIWQQAGLI